MLGDRFGRRVTRGAAGALVRPDEDEGDDCSGRGDSGGDEKRAAAVCTGIREDGPYVESGENDNLIVQKLEANPGTIGAFGYSYLEENTDKLKGISLNGVAPTYDSIATFKYPGSRPLYIYVKNAHVRAIPSVKAYIAEFTKEAAWGKGGYLVKRGMIAAPDAIRAKSATAARALTPLNPAEVN